MMYRFIVLCLALYFSFIEAENVTDNRPNILVILVDDMGIGDLSCYGNSLIKTPNIDSLAKEGIKFNRMYSQPVCTPSRAALLTGRLPVRNGFIQGSRELPVIVSPSQEAGFQKDEFTMQRFLKQHGYTTSLIGKWHLGMGGDGSYLPTNRGFDSFIGVPMVHIEPCSSYVKMNVNIFFGIAVNKYKWVISAFYLFILSLRVFDVIGRRGLFGVMILTALVVGIVQLFMHASAANPAACLYMRDEQILEQPYKDVNMTLRMTAEVLKTIENHSASEEPMFLHINYLTPHYPALVSHKFNGSSGLGPYYDSILELDWSIGLILKSLEKHHMKNNFIYFASDNGPAPLTGFSREILEPEHLGSTVYKDEKGKAHRLRGWKGSNYEGGIRMPGLIQWKGTLTNPGRIVNSITSQMDVFPTLVEILNADGKTHPEMDGESLLPIIKSTDIKQTTDDRIVFHYCSVNILGAVSYDRYKLHFANSTGNYTCSGNVFKQPVLYDVLSDPSESIELPLADNRQLLLDIYKLIERHEKTLPPIGERVSQLDTLLNPLKFPCSNFPYCTMESKVIDDFSNLRL
ncbi:arylsulfatase H-like [Tubulanus polymorphus]|uniref:arylsulfatase H-like n=1 Tax=Tubulanus polymorphus TaxID=672921 RepID=UPI003DA1E494